MPQVVENKKTANPAAGIKGNGTNMKVRDIMTKEIMSCSPSTNAASAAEIMWNANVGMLPVVEDGGRPVGVITDRDLFIALGTSDRPASALPVGEVMQKVLWICQPEDDIRTAMKTMAQQHVHRLPVVDENGWLKGILSLNDVALRAGSNGPSNDDVARTLRAVCSQTQSARTLQRELTPTEVAVA